MAAGIAGLGRMTGDTVATLARAGMSLTGALAALAAILAGSATWLLLTDPVTVAGTFRQGDVSSLALLLADAAVRALGTLLSYL